MENGETLVNCLAYIDLNPVRAGIVKKPEDYRWNSIGYHIQTNNQGIFLCLDFGLKEYGVKGDKERLRRYRRFLYENGGKVKENRSKINEKIVEKERQRDFKISETDRLLYRTRYFTDSGVIGSKAFVSQNYKRFKAAFRCQHNKIPTHVRGFEGIYSLKRLSENI